MVRCIYSNEQMMKILNNIKPVSGKTWKKLEKMLSRKNPILKGLKYLHD